MTTITKRFGVIKNARGRFAVCTDVSEDRKLYSQSYDLTYKKADFALQKAEDFTKSCYKDFTNFLGDPIHFEFVNMGLL